MGGQTYASRWGTIPTGPHQDTISLPANRYASASSRSDRHLFALMFSPARSVISKVVSQSLKQPAVSRSQ